MAGPGGGPPRRSHTKSRKGCKTCKRRHIRCDESFPQCRNCTKHSCRCDYMDAPSQSDERPKSPQGANLLWTPAVERDIEFWRQTGNFPFPEMHLYREPISANLSLTDLRLIHHVCSVSVQMQLEDSSRFTIWTHKIPMFLSIASSYNFVMHSLLAFSATHLGWMTKCPVTNSVGYHHRGIALKGLQEAIGNFSRENSDAVLAASILLSWQATDWRGWASLMQGTSTVIDAMQSWKHESNFADFMDEQPTFPSAQPTSTIRLETGGRKKPRPEDLAALQHILASIQRVGAYLKGREEESQHLNELMSFIQSLRTSLPVRTSAEQFQLLHPLRSWLFWLPISYSQRVNRDPLVMVLLAHFYAVALAVEPLFPAVGSAYFGSLSVSPIEEIYKNLATLEVEKSLDGNISISVGLMEFPLEMIATFRSRMGFVSQNARAYTSLERSPYDMGTLELDAEGEFVGLDNGYEGPFGQDGINLTPSTPHSASSSVARRPQILETQLHNSIDHFDVSAFAAYPLPRSPACFVTEDGSIYNSPAMDFSAGVHKDLTRPVSANWTLKSQNIYPNPPQGSGP